MAKTHVVYIVKENDKLYACDATIENGFDVLSWARERNASYVYLFPTKKECEEIAKQWNQSYIEQNKYLYQVK